MDDIAKNEARNYVTMVAFFVMALSMFRLFGERVFLTSDVLVPDTLFLMFGGVVLLILGILLAVLGERGLTTIFVMAIGMIMFAGNLFETVIPVVILLGIYIVLALLMLLGKDKKRLVYFVLALLKIALVVTIMAGLPVLVTGIIALVLVIIDILCAFACAAERVKFPGHDLLTAPETIDFKTSGSVLGYLMFAMVGAVWAAYYFLSENVIPLEAVQSFKVISALMLTIVAILLFAVAKMRFTPMVFLLVGFIFFVSTLVSGPIMYFLGIVMILLGIIALLRGESRVLLALFLLLYGLTYFISVLITGNYTLGIFNAILNLIPCAVALYLAFAVFSQKQKLLI